MNSWSTIVLGLYIRSRLSIAQWYERASLAGCHYNEEISQHLRKNTAYWPVKINDNKFATGQILRKPVEVVKGRILAG
jgi:hypothetical protein